jgi:hypothetical protein
VVAAIILGMATTEATKYQCMHCGEAIAPAEDHAELTVIPLWDADHGSAHFWVHATCLPPMAHTSVPLYPLSLLWDRPVYGTNSETRPL